MQIARFADGDDPRYAIVAGEELVVLAGDPLYSEPVPTGRRVRLEEVRLLAPIIPRSKVVGVGRNYPAHAAELGNALPTEPLLFLKPNTTVVGPDDVITLPAYSQQVEGEGELAVVIGRICKDVPVSQAGLVIAGYTAANDVTARDVQRTDVTWTRAKGFDSSCPLGPYLVTDLDPSDLGVKTWVNGELVQDARTSEMVFNVAELVSYVSSVMTLLPGDVILTGTPAGTPSVAPGDEITVEVEGIGSLRNRVA